MTSLCDRDLWGTVLEKCKGAVLLETAVKDADGAINTLTRLSELLTKYAEPETNEASDSDAIFVEIQGLIKGASNASGLVAALKASDDSAAAPKATAVSEAIEKVTAVVTDRYYGSCGLAAFLDSLWTAALESPLLLKEMDVKFCKGHESGEKTLGVKMYLRQLIIEGLASQNILIGNTFAFFFMKLALTDSTYRLNELCSLV